MRTIWKHEWNRTEKSGKDAVFTLYFCTLICYIMYVTVSYTGDRREVGFDGINHFIYSLHSGRYHCVLCLQMA